MTQFLRDAWPYFVGLSLVVAFFGIRLILRKARAELDEDMRNTFERFE